MATIHGPGHPPVIRPNPQGAGGTTSATPTPADALARLGLLGSGTDAQAALQKLLGFLVLQGFVPKPEGAKAGGQPLDDAAHLAQALKLLQGKEGLPATGRLDERTLKALEQFKQAGGAAERAAERQAAPADKQAAARTMNAFRDQSLSTWIKNKTADPSLRLPHQQPVNQPAQAHQAQVKPPQVEQFRTAAPPAQDSPQSTIARHDADTRALQADGRATREAGDGKPPPTPVQGGKPGQGNGEVGGRIRQAGEGAGHALAAPGGHSDDEVGLARGDAGQLTVYEDGRGNQATGDEDEDDERRGAALVDDGSGADEGAYEVPSLYEQIEAALDGLEREDDAGDNRPATYFAQFLLYRPGTYQSRTQAPQVLNLKVDRATAYDEVWGQVMDEVNKQLAALEPYSPRLDSVRVHAALQLARARSI